MQLKSKYSAMALIFFFFAASGSVMAQTVLNLDANPWEGAVVMNKTAISENDSAAQILNKAASVTASKRQMLHHQCEFTAFVHFGPNTFSGVEWGSGKENAHVFHPQGKVDTDQWCKIFKEAGMTKVIMTVKHHDGFCLWQTKYNSTFGVRATKWLNGKGDVLRSLSKSCQKYGLKLGVYLSPADLYQIENKNGLYGNGSKPQKSIIPTSVSTFQSDPTQPAKTLGPHLPTFEVIADDYNRYFMNQLYELLTEYGPIEEVWFDGAHPKRKGGQQYKKLQWFRMIRHLAPNAVIFGGPDVRWCGNERGDTRKSEWSVLTFQDESTCGEDRPANDIASDTMVVKPGYKVYGKPYKAKFLSYSISETDVSIRNGWFWRDERSQSVRSADNIFDIYERSVGGNSVLLLNVPPNRQGRIDQKDADCLKEVGRRIKETYQTIALDGEVIPTAKNSDQSNQKLPRFYFQNSEKTVSQVTKLAKKPTKINRIVIQEDVAKVGQRVSKFEVFVRNGQEEPFQSVGIGTTIGYKRIVRFPETEVTEIRFRVLESRAPARILRISGHHYRQPIPVVNLIPEVKNRRRTGKWFLKVKKTDSKFHSHSRAKQSETFGDSKDPIYFTFDGSQPNQDSTRYTGPLSLTEGGKLKARIFSDGGWGPMTEKVVPVPMLKAKIGQQNHLAVKTLKRPENVLDANRFTYWMATAKDRHLPALKLDLGESFTLASVSLTPLQIESRKQPGGFSLVNKGTIQISEDGKEWRKVCDFDFGNLQNDPSARKVLFPQPVTTRWVKICPMKTVDGGKVVSFAEVEFFPPVKK